MPRCPFAEQAPITGSAGPYKSGQFRIVHHTTEEHDAEAAMAAYKAKRADPHFTVDAFKVRQHIDTGVGARALRHDPAGCQTNLDSAVQIETVGFASAPKAKHTLTNLARLCRWIEATHAVPREWPSGAPKPAVNGADPGGHNRNVAIWETHGGHYGHCHVPENTHWDPGYTAIEAGFVIAAEFDAAGHLVNPTSPAVKALFDRDDTVGFTDEPPSVIDDHFDVGDTP